MLTPDLKGLIRNPVTMIKPVFFFILFVFLFALGLQFEQISLLALSPIVVWMAFLITCVNTIENVVRDDYACGFLTQLQLSPLSLPWILVMKGLSIWIVTCFPLLVFCPVLGVMLGLTLSQTMGMMFVLLVGSPALLWVGFLGSILTLSLPASGLLLSLLLLPLYTPILILGVSAIATLLSDAWPVFQLSLLGALSVLCITLVPFAAASGLQGALDD